MVKNRYYGNKKGATIPFMTRLSIETYQAIAEISEKVDVGLNQIGVALIEYALTHAELEECVGHRLRFKIPTIGAGKLAERPQEGANNEQVHSTAVHA